MKYKVFLNNPNRKWEEDSNIVWLCINDKFSMSYHKNQILLWPHVHEFMKFKYGPLYNIEWAPGKSMPQNVSVITNLKEDPLANKTGNQTMAGGDQAIGSQAVQANS